LKSLLDARDAFFLAGLGGVYAGVFGEFGWTWAAIVCGAVLLVISVLALRRKGD
jgi:hypothetical protein